MKMQQKTSLPTEVTSSKIIEETTTSPPESAKIFGRKFSASLENFATLSLRETRVEEGEEVNETETFRASNKRKREETPFQEVCSMWLQLHRQSLSTFLLCVQLFEKYLFHLKSFLLGAFATFSMRRSSEAGLGGCHC